MGDYYARLVSWYTQGGFTDEYGKRHDSNHHYKIDYWEVLNEVDGEHNMTPETYTHVYDAIVAAVHRVDPNIKFVGLGLGGTGKEYFEYFLNHKNHKPGIPLYMISYHFYAVPTADQTPEVMQFTYWDQADHFLDVVGFIQDIRARLSPETQTDTDELGSISADDIDQGKPGHVVKPIPELVLESLRRPVCLPLLGTGQTRRRSCRRIAACRLPHAVPQRFDGGLDQRPAQRPLLGAEAAA